VASEIKPDLIISSLFCMGLADALAASIEVPWCFVNPSFYFGDYSTRSWEEDWYGTPIRWFAQGCLLPLAQRADIVLHATDIGQLLRSDMPDSMRSYVRMANRKVWLHTYAEASCSLRTGEPAFKQAVGEPSEVGISPFLGGPCHIKCTPFGKA
jgi:hypothetical protein